MRYLPHTNEDITSMLRVIGVNSLNDLFSTIPDHCCSIKEMDLPGALTEWELDKHMNALASKMASSNDSKIYIGAGSYDHHIPSVCSYLLGRGEFVTAYTPYQPEISQGTLQAIYEYQTLVTRLLGMDVANASMYDGASGLAEALLMSIRITRRQKVGISSLIHPLYRRVVKTYFEPTGYEVIEIPYRSDGRTDISQLDNLDEMAGIAVQSPNFFGCIEDLKAMGKKIHSDNKTMFITCFTEPLAYGLLKSPGNLGADIACGEGQSFGIPQSFGGPGLGMFAAKKKFMRSMPGRLIGKTKDLNGKSGFVLTLSTREQHIRREKATSNICSNQGLCATASAMYMATLGGTGLKHLSGLNRDKAEYLKTELVRAGCKAPFSSPTFNEFIIEFPDNFKEVYENLYRKNIVAGLPIENYYPELSNHYLLCVTETSSKEDMDVLVKEVTS